MSVIQIGVERTDCTNHEMCVVHFTDETSFTMTAVELADCILESHTMQRSPSGRTPARRQYMKEWAGVL